MYQLSDIIAVSGLVVILIVSYLYSFYEHNRRVARVFSPTTYCLSTGKRLHGFVFIILSIGVEPCTLEVSNTYTRKILKTFFLKSYHKSFKILYFNEQFLTLNFSDCNDFVATIISFK